MIFKSSRALKAENEALASKLATLEASQAAAIAAATNPLTARISELESAVTESEQEVAEAEKAIEAADKSAADAQASAKAAAEKLFTVEAENAKKIEAAASIKASEIVASLGHKPIPAGAPAATTAPKGLTAQERLALERR